MAISHALPGSPAFDGRQSRCASAQASRPCAVLPATNWLRDLRALVSLSPTAASLARIRSCSWPLRRHLCSEEGGVFDACRSTIYDGRERLVLASSLEGARAGRCQTVETRDSTEPTRRGTK